MPDLAYLSTVFMGAVALMVEAYRQYRQPVPDYMSPGNGLVDPSELATQGGYMRGLAFYTACYLALYFALLSSTLLRSLLLATDPNQKMVGAQSFLEQDAAKEILFNEGTVTPLVISTGVITALSLGFGKQVEGILKTISYWLAGIPRGFYVVIDTIRTFDFREQKEADIAYKKRRERKDVASEYQDGPLKLLFDRQKSLLEAIEAPAADLAEFGRNLSASDALLTSVFDRDGSRCWPSSGLRALGEDIGKVRTKHDKVLEDLAACKDKGQLDALVKLGGELRGDSEAVFAQLYIRSGHRKLPAKGHARILIRFLRERGLGFGAVSAQAAVIGFLVGVPLYIVIDVAYQALASDDFVWSAVGPMRVLTADWAGALASALATTARFGIFIWIASGLAAVFQNNLSSTGLWRPQRDMHVRLLQLVGWSIAPALIATVALFGVALLTRALTVAFTSQTLMTKNQVADFTRDGKAFYAGCFGLALLVAYFTLRTIDRRKAEVRGRPLPRWRFPLAALGFSAAWLVYSGILIVATYKPIVLTQNQAEIYESLSEVISVMPPALNVSIARAVAECLQLATVALPFFLSFGWLMSNQERRR